MAVLLQSCGRMLVYAGTLLNPRVQLLLAAGSAADTADPDGQTSLYLAAEIGQTKCMELLLNARAAVDQADNRGCTPLYVAVLERNDPTSGLASLDLFLWEMTTISKRFDFRTLNFQENNQNSYTQWKYMDFRQLAGICRNAGKLM